MANRVAERRAVPLFGLLFSREVLTVEVSLGERSDQFLALLGIGGAACQVQVVAEFLQRRLEEV